MTTKAYTVKIYAIIIDKIPMGFFQTKEDAQAALKEYVKEGYIVEREL